MGRFCDRNVIIRSNGQPVEHRPNGFNRRPHTSERSKGPCRFHYSNQPPERLPAGIR
uniref:Uncharacterized protein n=1 Tax=Streptomyces violaceusniger TaxID=68280 RepID=A0A6F8Z2N2_STRVO|nr:hypothetical protein [Streptomyces violaceusniger]